MRGVGSQFGQVKRTSVEQSDANLHSRTSPRSHETAGGGGDAGAAAMHAYAVRAVLTPKATPCFQNKFAGTPLRAPKTRTTAALTKKDAKTCCCKTECACRDCKCKCWGVRAHESTTLEPPLRLRVALTARPSQHAKAGRTHRTQCLHRPRRSIRQ